MLVKAGAAALILTDTSPPLMLFTHTQFVMSCLTKKNTKTKRRKRKRRIPVVPMH